MSIEPLSPAARGTRGRESGTTARAGVVVTLIGLPGAGKSVVARALEDQLGLRRIDRDAIRHAMFPRCAYSYAEKRAAFRGMLLALEINCLLGASSVLDGATFSRQRDRMRCAAVIERYGFRPLTIYLDCPPEVARARIARDVEHDQHLARDRTPAVVSEVLMRFEPPPTEALVIDATQSAAAVCRLAIEAVAALCGGTSRPQAGPA
jgi:predicted kinase